MGKKTKNSILEKIDRFIVRITGPTTRFNYWSCSPLARWVRQKTKVETKPYSDTLEGWAGWRARNVDKFGYWLTEELFDTIQNIVHFPADVWNSFRYYIKNRFFDKMHYLPTRLKPGQYNDLDTRILHGLMEALVDFVEIEKAHMQWAFYTPSAKKTRDWFMYGTKPKVIPRPIAHRYWFIRFYSDRSREAGMEHLQWEMTLDTPGANEDYEWWVPPAEGVVTQAIAAKEVVELYTWWKDVYPNRPDPMDVSGWTAYYEQKTEKDGYLWSEKTPEEREITTAMHKQMQEIEEQYAKEDEDNLIRLIKIRKHLWT